MEKLHHGCEPRRSTPRMSAAPVRRNTYRMQCLRYWTFLFGREVACASAGLVRRNQGCRWVVLEKPGTSDQTTFWGMQSRERPASWSRFHCKPLARMLLWSVPAVRLTTTHHTGRPDEMSCLGNDLRPLNMCPSGRVIERSGIYGTLDSWVWRPNVKEFLAGQTLESLRSIRDTAGTFDGWRWHRPSDC